MPAVATSRRARARRVAQIAAAVVLLVGGVVAAVLCWQPTSPAPSAAPADSGGWSQSQEVARRASATVAKDVCNCTQNSGAETGRAAFGSSAFYMNAGISIGAVGWWVGWLVSG